MRMLGALDEVAAIDDPHIGHHLSVWRPISLAWATGEEIPQLTTLPSQRRDRPSYFFSDRYRSSWEPALRELISARFEAEARDVAVDRGSEGPVVVVKDPGASGVAELISRLFPRSLLVFLLRDGRDVIDSWLDGYSAGSWGLAEGAYPLTPEGRRSFIRWQASVWLQRTESCQRAMTSHAPDRRLLVRYEDLHRNPVSTLRTICRSSGLKPGAFKLRRIANRFSYARVPSDEKGSGHAVRWAAPGSWKHHMSRDEANAMLEIIGPKLAELGYLDDPVAEVS